MNTIGQFDYPTETTFSETLEIAKEALNRYGGFMSNLAVTQKLGYNYKKAAGISGWVYRRFDDMCMFGLFVRERGGIRTTDLAKEALDPYDSEKASKGKLKAISNVPLFAKALTDWKGGLPDQDAFPAKLAELASVDWVEAKKYSDILQKLISDCFAYHRPSVQQLTASVPFTGTVGASIVTDRGETRLVETGGVSSPFGEVRTLVGTVVIKNTATLRLARNLLDVLEGEIKEKETEEKKPAKKGGKEPKEEEKE